ncbi:MAG: hypothetical protein M0019_05890 [Actinomycetota bacterium]|nr:hypothetical protein [Actinomycetota bacterium]
MISLFAPAKLTLGFKVTGLREDGYHFIDSEMTMLSYGDLITVRALFDRASSKASNFKVDDPCGLSKFGFDFGQVPTGSSNLLDKVASLFELGLEATISKRIPVGGGLGGGSADAGALGRYLWSIDSELRFASIDDYVARLAKFGADIPVCFLGGRSRVSGIGDVVSILSPTTGVQGAEVGRCFTLFMAPITISTPEVYRSYDRGDSFDFEEGQFSNDLEGPALSISPRLVNFRRSIEETFSITPSLAGSGSTYFVSGHVLDRISDKQTALTKNCDLDGVRMAYFSDIYDPSNLYLACECVEVQLGEPI